MTIDSKDYAIAFRVHFQQILNLDYIHVLNQNW